MALINKALRVIRRDGFSAAYQRAAARLRSVKIRRDYRRYRQTHQLTTRELNRERRTHFDVEPVFAVVIPLYQTKPAYLHDLITSFQAQTYPNFKLFLVDASPLINQSATAITEIINQYSAKDPRLVYQVLGQNFGIAENTNHAIELAMRDKSVTHICLCDHDDYVEPNTFYEYAKAINEHPDTKILYSDEDVTTGPNDRNAYPSFKPDFDIYHLESSNFINHFFACEKSLFKQLKQRDGTYERPAYDGAQDYDLYLRLAELATFTHIPQVLYHWRAGDTSTAEDPKNKLYAFDAGKRALEDYCRRNHIAIQSVEHTATFGTYRTIYKKTKTPPFTIIDTTTSPAEQSRLIATATSDYLLFINPKLQYTKSDLSELFTVLQRTGVNIAVPLILNQNGTIHSSVDNLFRGENPAYTYMNRARCVSATTFVPSDCYLIRKADYGKPNLLSVYTPHAIFRMV